MKEQDVGKIYARSIGELGEAKGVDVAAELTQIQILINENNDLENLLFLDIFSSNEKQIVLNEIFKKISPSSLVERFVHFLIEEKRINLLPFIYKEVMVLDDYKKGFIRGTIEGKEDSISSEDHERISKFLKEKVGREPKLEYKKRKGLTAGYRITAEDLHLDASIDHQFDMLKQSILGD